MITQTREVSYSDSSQSHAHMLSDATMSIAELSLTSSGRKSTKQTDARFQHALTRFIAACFRYKSRRLACMFWKWKYS